jgi:hypothetical protein
MVGRLQEPDAWKLSLTRAREQRVHQCPADLAVLYFRIDRDGPEASNRGALIEAVAAHNPPVEFSDDAVEAGMRKHHGQNSGSDFNVWKIGRKVVCLCY